ncbi:MAG: rcc01693 family protein [Pseudomonadota bacterium]
MSVSLDWIGMMRVGLRDLRLRPADFWGLTPAELAFLVGDAGRNARMDRAGLDALAARFPDRTEKDHDG